MSKNSDRYQQQRTRKEQYSQGRIDPKLMQSLRDVGKNMTREAEPLRHQLVTNLDMGAGKALVHSFLPGPKARTSNL